MKTKDQYKMDVLAPPFSKVEKGGKRWISTPVSAMLPMLLKQDVNSYCKSTLSSWVPNILPT
jgi:hypothetical protein